MPGQESESDGGDVHERGLIVMLVGGWPAAPPPLAPPATREPCFVPGSRMRWDEIGPGCGPWTHLLGS